MPLADYRCAPCNILAEDQVFAMAVGAVAAAPDCPHCGNVMTWIPTMNMDLKTDGAGGKGFQKFSVDVDGQKTEIDSMHTLRRVERESEQRYRNGEGEPIRFRGYSQDSSNMDVHGFGEKGTLGERTWDSGAQPRKKKNISVKKHKEAPNVALGPGMKDGASALKD